MTETFSFYKGGIWVTTPSAEIDVEKLLGMVKDGTYKPIVEKLRALKTKEEQRELKRTSQDFDYVTVGGIFSTRGKEKITEPSGLMCQDIDNIKKPEELKDKLKTNKFVHACFISPSGRGLKVIVKIPIDPFKYEGFFLAFAKSIGQDINQIDRTTKDISRACFLSWDTEPYYNPDSDVWATYYEEPQWEEVELNRDNTRSGYEMREVIKLMREGKSIKEIKEVAKTQYKNKEGIVMWQKWNKEGTHYQQRTITTAQKYVAEHPAMIEKTIPTTFETPTLMEALKNMKPPRWIIKGLIPVQGILYISGAPKSFKSILSFYTALCMAAGRPLFDQEKFSIVEKKKVLIIQEENAYDMLQKLSLLAKGMNFGEEEAKNAGESIHVSLCNRITLDSLGGRQDMAIAKLKAKVDELQPDVIIYDSAVRMMEGDENRATDVRRIESTFKALMSNKEILHIVIHHLTKKKDGMRGSGDFIAQADVALELNSSPKYNGVVYAKIPFHRNMPGGFNEFHFRVWSEDSEGKRLRGKDIDPDKIMCMKVGDYDFQEDAGALTESQREVWDWITETNQKKDFKLADIERILDEGGFSFKKSTLQKTLSFFVKIGKLKRDGETKQSKYVYQAEIQDEFADSDLTEVTEEEVK